jgi:hypothetical protein
MLDWLRRKKRIVQTHWSAGAYFLEDRIVLHSMSRTSNNIGWYNQPVFAVPKDAPDRTVGECLRAALEASTWESQQDDSQYSTHPILREAGATTWPELEERSKFVIIETDRTLVKVLPTRRATKTEGGKGFIHMPELQIEVAWNSPASDLGLVLCRGAERC